MSSVYNGCTRPLKAFPIGYNDSGKTKYKICNYKINHLENGKPVETSVLQNPKADIISDFIEIPCGKCPNCLLRYSRQWRDRCIAESMYHEHNYFVTLTYSNKTVRNGGTGNPTLYKRDLQLFWKRLRSAGFKFRYFCCGEYGDKTHRPHYHALVFGLDLPEGDVFVDDLGHKRSKILEKYWYDEFQKDVQLGFVEVGEFNEKTASYVSRYTYKKAFQDLQLFYDTFKVAPQFVLMSRRPAIGLKFFEDHGLFLYDNSCYSYSTEKGGRKLFPTKYWTNKLEVYYPELYEEVKNNALDYQLNKRLILLKNNPRSYLDILKDQEKIITERTSALRERDLH